MVTDQEIKLEHQQECFSLKAVDEPRASNLLGKHFAIEPHSSASLTGVGVAKPSKLREAGKAGAGFLDRSDCY